MVVTLVLGVVALAAQPPAAGWEHVLVRHESYEDFYADGWSSAYRATLDAEGPVTLTAGQVQGSDDPAEAAFAEAPEWLNGFYESAELVVPGGFSEALVSWNAVAPPGTGLCLELRVRRNADEPWSPWLWVGDWGDATPPPLYLRRADPGGPRVDPAAPRTVTFDGGRIDVDYFKSDERFERAQYRVRSGRSGGLSALSLRLRRVVLCFSRRVEGPQPEFAFDRQRDARRLEVPFRSQRTEEAELAGRICSPTSVAMMMTYRGVDVPTLEVARRVFDAQHDIYGNWTRAVQGAYSFGVPGYLARFSDWNEVARLLAAGQPLVISIAAAEGQLEGAPYRQTDGHLLVLCGFDEHGDVRVNDPAAGAREQGALVYRREQVQQVWMERGGVAYVFLPRER